MRRLAATTLLLALPLLLAAAPAAAAVCALDDVPAATLMLPYFEVDLADPGGPTTLFSIGNAAGESAMTRVTVWSDLGVPVLWFYVELTGWDVQTINLRDVMAGNLPLTGGPNSPLGDASIPAANFPGCGGSVGGPLPEAQAAHVRAWLSGQPSAFAGADVRCAGVPYDDALARGWVSVDLVSGCSEHPPGPDYYGGDLAHDNVLFGDFFLVDPSQDAAWGESLVRLESHPAAFVPGEPTFYGSWVDGSAVDGREPLPTVWASRNLIGGTFDAGTELVAWREIGEPTEPFACDEFPQQPPWFPLTHHLIQAFDERETWYDFFEPCTVLCPPPEPFVVFYAQAQRLQANGPEFPLPFPFGFVVVDFALSGAPEQRRQAWLGSVMRAGERFSVGLDATPLDRGCDPEVTAPVED